MMKYQGYIGKVTYDDEAGLFHGEVVNIRDVITFQGRSVDELKQAFQDSVDDYLEFCETRGEDPNKPYSGRFVLRLDPEVHRRIATAAKLEGKSLNAWAAEALADLGATMIPVHEQARIVRERKAQSTPTTARVVSHKRSGVKIKAAKAKRKSGARAKRKSRKQA